jgi:hypothetical protein
MPLPYSGSCPWSCNRNNANGERMDTARSKDTKWAGLISHCFIVQTVRDCYWETAKGATVA